MLLLGHSSSHAPRRFIADAGTALRRDPTGTGALRRKFGADMDRRWSRVRRAVLELVGQQDAFSLGRGSNRQVAVTLQSGGHVKSFHDWLRITVEKNVTDPGMERWITSGWHQGKRRAERLVRATAHVSMGDGPITAADMELRGITDAVLQQATRVFYNGSLSHKRSPAIAREIAQKIRNVGVLRTRALVSFSVVRAHALATAQVFREVGVQQVGVLPEYVRSTRIGDAKPKLQKLGTVNVLTAGDDDVCPVCESISDDGPYDIDDALELIPAHPHCRCAFVPVMDKRFSQAQLT